MIDKDTGMLYVVKRPSPESRTYGLDFKRLLSAIHRVDSVVITPSTGIDDLTVSDISFKDTVVMIVLSGGSEGVSYKVATSVTDLYLNTLTETFLTRIPYR